MPSFLINNPTFEKTFVSLRSRNFRLYFMGQIVSNTGNWLTNVALTLLVLHLANSGLAVGLLAACQYGPILLFSIWGGAVADRSDKRRLLLVTQSVEMAQSIGLAILAFRPHPSLYGLYGLAIFGGIALAFDSPLRRSFVSEMVAEEDIPNAVVLYSTIVNISRIFGPALAGLLIVSLGYGWCFAIDAVSYVAVLICLLLMRPREIRRRPAKARVKGEVMEGFRYLLSQPNLRISFAMLAAIGLLSYNFNVTLPLFVVDTLHGNNSTFTILYSIFSLGAVISALTVAQRGLVKIRHAIFGAAALGLTMLLLSSTSDTRMAALAILLTGMASIIYLTSTSALVQVEARPDMHGRVLAIQSILLAGTTPLGGPFLGWLADHWGGRAPMILGGVVCLLVALFGHRADRIHHSGKQHR